MLLFYKVYKIDLCKNFEDHFFLLTWYKILVLAAWLLNILRSIHKVHVIQEKNLSDETLWNIRTKPQ